MSVGQDRDPARARAARLDTRSASVYQRQMNELTERVRAYWDANACGTAVASAERFTRAYFDQIEDHRYAVEPFIHEFAQFTRWRGKQVLEVGVGAGTDFLQWARAGAPLSRLISTGETET